jgi:hypothetical protein
VTRDEMEQWRARAMDFSRAAYAWRRAMSMTVSPDCHQTWVEAGKITRVLPTEIWLRYEAAEAALPLQYLNKMKEILEEQIPTGWPWQEDQRPS